MSAMALLAVSLLYMLAYMRIAQREIAAACVGVEDYSIVVTGAFLCLSRVACCCCCCTFRRSQFSHSPSETLMLSAFTYSCTHPRFVPAAGFQPVCRCAATGCCGCCGEVPVTSTELGDHFTRIADVFTPLDYGASPGSGGGSNGSGRTDIIACLPSSAAAGGSHQEVRSACALTHAHTHTHTHACWNA